MSFGQPPIRLTPEGEADRQRALKLGWVMNGYAEREGCVACPSCAVLQDVYAALHDQPCHGCKWRAPANPDAYAVTQSDVDQAQALVQRVWPIFESESNIVCLIALAGLVESVRESSEQSDVEHDALWRAILQRMRTALRKAVQ